MRNFTYFYKFFQQAEILSFKHKTETYTDGIFIFNSGARH